MTRFLFRFAGDCQARTFWCSLASKPTTIASTVKITSLRHQGTCWTVRGIVPGRAQHNGQQTLQEPPSRQAQGVVQLVRCSAPHSQSGPPLGCKPGLWRQPTRTGQRRGMKGRRGEFGENSLRCNELLPPEIRSRIGPARTRKNAFHIHDFIVDFIAWHPMQSLWHHMMTSKLWHHTGCNALKSNAEPMTSYDDIKTMTSYRM